MLLKVSSAPNLTIDTTLQARSIANKKSKSERRHSLQKNSTPLSSRESLYLRNTENTVPSTAHCENSNRLQTTVHQDFKDNVQESERKNCLHRALQKLCSVSTQTPPLAPKQISLPKKGIAELTYLLYGEEYSEDLSIHNKSGLTKQLKTQFQKNNPTNLSSNDSNSFGMDLIKKLLLITKITITSTKKNSKTIFYPLNKTRHFEQFDTHYFFDTLPIDIKGTIHLITPLDYTKLRDRENPSFNDFSYGIGEGKCVLQQGSIYSSGATALMMVLLDSGINYHYLEDLYKQMQTGVIDNSHTNPNCKLFNAYRYTNEVRYKNKNRYNDDRSLKDPSAPCYLSTLIPRYHNHIVNSKALLENLEKELEPHPSIKASLPDYIENRQAFAAIVNINGHFIVVDSVTSGYVWIRDPYQGTLSIVEKEAFAKQALQLEILFFYRKEIERASTPESVHSVDIAEHEATFFRRQISSDSSSETENTISDDLPFGLTDERASAIVEATTQKKSPQSNLRRIAPKRILVRL